MREDAIAGAGRGGPRVRISKEGLDQIRQNLRRPAEEDPTYWPKEAELADIAPRLLRVLRDGRRIQKAGGLIRSGVIAYALKEILESVRQLETTVPQRDSDGNAE